MPADPLLGTVIGNVRLDARLGAGAMGVVYRGQHLGLGREVAVKLLSHGNDDGRSRERFLREGRAAAKVHSQHVVQVLDAGWGGGRTYLVMELVVGRSVGDLLDAVATEDRARPPADRPPGSLPAEAVARIGHQVALGLIDAHAAGVIHRDIKPDNILIATDGTAKIVDLGLAKQLDDPELQRLTGTGMVVGTPLYVSPDAIANPQGVTAQADVYSLGATLYHCLAGKPPFDGQTPYEVMKAHLEGRLQRLRELRPACPAGLAEVIERCLEKQPLRRPTPAEVARLLAQGTALRGRRQRAPLVAAGMLAAGVLATGGGAWWWLTRPPPVPPGGRIQVLTDHPRVLASLDGGAWAPLPADGLAATAGRHRLDLRADQGGPLVAWSGVVEVAPGGAARSEAHLARRSVAASAVPFPGRGMLFVEGGAFGTDQQLSFTSPGTYAVGRWDGQLWTAGQAVVGEDGRIALGTLTSRDRPEGPAWWRDTGPDDRPCPTHHVVSWWLADQVRERSGLAVAPAWRMQAVKPEQPAVEFPIPLLTAVLDGLAALGGRLPGPDEARALARTYQVPVWSGAPGQPPVALGGPARNAWLLLVPAR